MEPAEIIAVQLRERMPVFVKEGFNEGEAYFDRLVAAGKTKGPKGPDNLHMRAGITNLIYNGHSVSRFVQSGERSLGAYGEDFAPITYNKAWTAAQFLLDTDTAVKVHGDLIPDNDDGRRYTGGVCYLADFVHNGVTYQEHIVVACSGVEGVDDRAVGYVIALTIASEWTKALKQLLGIDN